MELEFADPAGDHASAVTPSRAMRLRPGAMPMPERGRRSGGSRAKSRRSARLLERWSHPSFAQNWPIGCRTASRQRLAMPMSGRVISLPVLAVTDCPDRRYDTKLWMRDLKEGAAYLPK
jgi:hypothetical protein